MLEVVFSAKKLHTPILNIHSSAPNGKIDPKSKLLQIEQNFRWICPYFQWGITALGKSTAARGWPEWLRIPIHPLIMSRRQFQALKVIKNSIWGLRKSDFTFSTKKWYTPFLNVCSSAPIGQNELLASTKKFVTQLHVLMYCVTVWHT